jgi:hypothetical protein
MPQSYEFAFLIYFAGGLVAALITYLLDKFIVVPTTSFAVAPIAYYPNAVRLRVASFAIICAWSALILFLVLVGLAAIDLWRPVNLAVWMLAAFYGFAVLYFGLSFPLKCPSCLERVTVQWTSEPKYTERVWRLDGWASVVVQVATTGKFRCMYCGQRFTLARDEISDVS